MSNRPKIEHYLTPCETSYLMDLLHADWSRMVTASALFTGAYDAHIRAWRKARASQLLNMLDRNAEAQGFWEDGKGL